MKKIFLLLLVISKLTSANEIKNPSYHYSFSLPYGWDTIPYSKIKSTEEEVMKNRVVEGSNMTPSNYHAGIYFKQNSNYFEYPYILMLFSQVKNINSISLDTIFGQFTKNNFKEGVNVAVGDIKGISNPQFDILNTFYIDTSKATGFFIGQVDYKNVGTVNVLTSMHVCSDGILFIYCYSLKPSPDNIRSSFKEVLNSISFEKEHTYHYEKKESPPFNWARLAAFAIVFLIIGFVRKLRGGNKKPQQLIK